MALAVGHFLDDHNGAVSAAATVVIAILTVVLVIVTNRQAKLTGASVRIAEKALVELEGPVLVVVDHALFLANPLANNDRQVVTSFKVRNIGRTPAILTEVSEQYGQWSAKLDAPAYGKGAECREVIQEGSAFAVPGRNLPEHPVPHGSYVFFGYLKYTDIFGANHVTGFGLRNGRIASGGAAFNYHHVERET